MKLSPLSKLKLVHISPNQSLVTRVKAGSVWSRPPVCVYDVTHSWWWTLRGGFDGGEWGTNELALSMASLCSVLTNGQGTSTELLMLHVNTSAPAQCGAITSFTYCAIDWRVGSGCPQSVTLVWNRLFSFQNQSICGEHSRWGLWGIIRAEGPDAPSWGSRHLLNTK